jgi:hypothetical protein
MIEDTVELPQIIVWEQFQRCIVRSDLSELGRHVNIADEVNAVKGKHLPLVAVQLMARSFLPCAFASLRLCVKFKR